MTEQRYSPEEESSIWAARPRYWIWDRRTGNVRPADTWEEGREFMRHAPHILAYTTTRKSRLSTVFLGLDHCMRCDGVPVLWETLVLAGPMEGQSERYESHAAAAAGHLRWVDLVKARELPLPEDPPELSI